MTPVEFAVLFVGTWITFGLYASLAGVDNPFFAFSEHSYVGFGIGFTTYIAFFYIWSYAIRPMITEWSNKWYMIFAIILGLMMWTRFHPKYAYISRIPIAISMGITLALSVRTLIFSHFTQQIKATILPLWVAGDPMRTFTNIMVVFFVVTIITFFFYSTEIRGPHKVSYTIGEYVLYASFGGLWAMTFMGRTGLFVGRMQDLVSPVSPYYPINLYVSAGIGAFMMLAIGVLYKFYPELLEKLTPE